MVYIRPMLQVKIKGHLDADNSMAVSLPTDEDATLTKLWYENFQSLGQNSGEITESGPGDFSHLEGLIVDDIHRLNLTAHFMEHMNDITLKAFLTYRYWSESNATELCANASEVYTGHHPICGTSAVLVAEHIAKVFPNPTEDQARILKHVSLPTLGTELKVEQAKMRGRDATWKPRALGWLDVKMFLSELRRCEAVLYFPIHGCRTTDALPTTSLPSGRSVPYDLLDPSMAEELSTTLKEHGLSDLMAFLDGEPSDAWDSAKRKIEQATVNIQAMGNGLAGELTWEMQAFETNIAACFRSRTFNDGLDAATLAVRIETDPGHLQPCDLTLDFAPHPTFHLLDAEDFLTQSGQQGQSPGQILR